jgi:Cyanate lyase C-terminal domain
MRNSATASSAQSNFKLDIKKVDDPEGGSRAVITLDGKYLPTKSFSETAASQANSGFAMRLPSLGGTTTMRGAGWKLIGLSARARSILQHQFILTL